MRSPPTQSITVAPQSTEKQSTNPTLSDADSSQGATDQIDPPLLLSGIKIPSMDPIEEMRLFGSELINIHKKYYQVINRALDFTLRQICVFFGV